MNDGESRRRCCRFQSHALRSILDSEVRNLRAGRLTSSNKDNAAENGAVRTLAAFKPRHCGGRSKVLNLSFPYMLLVRNISSVFASAKSYSCADALCSWWKAAIVASLLSKCFLGVAPAGN